MAAQLVVLEAPPSANPGTESRHGKHTKIPPGYQQVPFKIKIHVGVVKPS